MKLENKIIQPKWQFVDGTGLKIDDILNLFDSTDLSYKSLFEIITKYSNAVRKQPILIMAKDRDSLKRDLQSFIDAGCKGIILGVNPLL